MVSAIMPVANKKLKKYFMRQGLDTK